MLWSKKMLHFCENIICTENGVSPTLAQNPKPNTPVSVKYAHHPKFVLILGAFIHKKDRDFHRDYALVQTSGNISLIAERDDSGHQTAHAWYQALPLFWYARLEWWDRKYQDYLLERSHICRDANNRTNSQIIARCIAICSAMLIAIISEIFMSTLVKISRFRSRCKHGDLHPANSRKCECPFCDHIHVSYFPHNFTLITIFIFRPKWE